MKIALDTNILAYADGINGESMKRAAVELLRRLPLGSVVVPAQVLAELFNVLVRKDNQSRPSARKMISDWQNMYSIVPTSGPVITSALELASAHGLSIWDSIVLSSAVEVGSALLLSHDLQDGFSWRGVTVANPFASRVNAVLSALLE